jgi:D-inositol-3-phosphate glycosyltransferase
LEKLKIFIIGPAYPLRGGPAEFNQNLCLELIKAGHDAQIISYSLQYPNFLFPGSSQFEKSGTAPIGIKIHTLINTINPFNWFKVAAFIKKEKPNFILFRYWLPFFGPCLGTIGKLSKSKTKILALTDNVIPHEKRFGDKLLTRYFINNCNGFIAMSKKVLSDITLFNKSKQKTYSPHPMYETYGNSVSKVEACKQLKLNENKKYILFFGLIRHYKGLDILIDAFNKSNVSEDVYLLIAGEFYEAKETYLTQIQNSSKKNQIILHDKFIPNDIVRYYFCASSLVAQTYRDATNSGVTMVGYYYNKPMLVTNVGGLKEIVPDNKCGFVVDNNIEKISEKINQYFLNNFETEFSENVKIEKKKYEWSTFIQNLIKLYNSTLNK